jgi:tetratricopeptide (TPR) repeat protein
LTNLGTSSLMARQVPAALEQLRQAVESGKKYDTGRGSWLPVAQAEYAHALARSGNLGEADRVLAEALPFAKESKTQSDLAMTYNAFGLVKQYRNQWSESEQAYRQAMELTPSTGVAQKVRSEAILGVGIALLEMGNAAEAESFFRQADEAASRNFLKMMPLRADITLNLGRSLLAQKKLDAARESFAIADAYWRGYDASNHSAGEAAYWLGQGHLAADAKPEARATLLRSIEILKTSPQPGHQRLLTDARQTVARL